MNETDKRFVEVFQQYYRIYLNGTTPVFAASDAAKMTAKHMELYALELEVRLAEAKK